MAHLRLCPPVDASVPVHTTARLMTLHVHGSRGQLVDVDMPGPVVTLEAHRPHEDGLAQCTMCMFTWMAVAPVKRVAHLACPQCRGPALFPLPIMED